MIILDKFAKIFDWLGRLMAFLTIILIALLFLNAKFPFLGDKAALLTTIKEYAVLSTLIVVGLGFASRRSILLFIPFCIFAVIAVVFSFPALF